MQRQLGIVVYPTSNLETSKRFFRTLLGVEPYADSPYYVGFRPGEVDIGLDPNASARGIDGPVVYWDTPNIENAVDELVRTGATVHAPATDVGGGLLVAILRDNSGNLIGLREAVSKV